MIEGLLWCLQLDFTREYQIIIFPNCINLIWLDPGEPGVGTRGLGNDSKDPCLIVLSNKTTGSQDSLLLCNPFSKNLRHAPQG